MIEGYAKQVAGSRRLNSHGSGIEENQMSRHGDHVQGQEMPITQLLHSWQKGDQSAGDSLIPVLYAELKRIASAYLEREIDSPSLQTTELVNEAFIRLLDQQKVEWEDRSHFFGFAARVMRQLLIEHARKRRAQKRGGDEDEATLPDNNALSGRNRPPDLIKLDEALDALDSIDPKKCKLVELKYFAGLTNEEIAQVLDISVSTVKREWTVAKTWLYKYLSEGM